MRDSLPGWVVGSKGRVLPWAVLGLVLVGTFVVDRHWQDELEGARAAAQQRADELSVSYTDALGNMISARIGALAAPRMRFTPIQNAVSDRTFAAALDSVTINLEGLAAVSAVTLGGHVTRGTDALIGRPGFGPSVDTVVGRPMARAVATRAPAATGIASGYGTRRVFYFEPVLSADTAVGVLVAELDPTTIFRAVALAAPANNDITPGIGLYGPGGTQVNTLRVPLGWRSVDRPVRVADTEWLLRVAYPPPDPRPYAVARIATWITGAALGIALAAILAALRRIVGSQTAEIRRREQAEGQARQAALDAVESEREAHELTLQLEAAHSAAQRLSTSLDPDYVLEFFLGAVGETLDADTASLYTFDEEGDFLVGRKRLVLREVYPHTDRLTSEDIRAVRVPVAMLPQLAEAVSSGEPRVMADAASVSPGGLPGGVETAAAWVTIPLQVGGHMMGVAIWEVFRGPQSFDQKDVAFAQALAAQAAAALRTAELYASLERVSARATWEAIRFGTVLDQMADGVVLVDGAGRLERYNAAAERLLGPRPASGSAAAWLQGLSLHTPEHRRLEAAEIPLQRALRGETVTRMTFLAEAEDGSERHLSSSAAPIVPEGEDGGHAGAAMVVRDVTDEQQYAGMLRHTNQELRKQAALLEEINQQLREATAAKDRFLAVMSHELRTPLNAVIGYADLLDLQIKGSLNPEQQQMVRRVIETARHLLALIDEVLDLAKVGAGHVELKLEPIDLHEVLDQALDQVTPLAHAKGLSLALVRGDGTVTAVADRTRLTQVILNLLSNAVKFTDRGGVTVAARRNGGETVELSVRDTGRGIRKDLLERIFEEFYQVEDGLTRSAGGTGLGLAIARRYARLMGGDLTVASEFGEGSEFTVVLPAG